MAPSCRSLGILSPSPECHLTRPPECHRTGVGGGTCDISSALPRAAASVVASGVAFSLQVTLSLPPTPRPTADEATTVGKIASPSWRLSRRRRSNQQRLCRPPLRLLGRTSWRPPGDKAT